MAKIQYFVKMNIFEGTDSWAMRCSHIGEVKLFAYILATFNQNDMTWTYTAEKQKAIQDKFGISRPTTFNYLKHLASKDVGILIKKSKGEYQVNSEFVEYGNKKK